jgi:hypothetical protein
MVLTGLAREVSKTFNGFLSREGVRSSSMFCCSVVSLWVGTERMPDIPTIQVLRILPSTEWRSGIAPRCECISMETGCVEGVKRCAKANRMVVASATQLESRVQRHHLFKKLRHKHPKAIHAIHPWSRPKSAIKCCQQIDWRSHLSTRGLDLKAPHCQPLICSDAHL